jgi:Family of unknown function (DUF5677)
MEFEDEGFLSPELTDWTTATRAQFKDWFELVYDLNRDAMKILAAIEPEPNQRRDWVASLLYRRALQSFQAAVLMAERGMIADALTLVRSCTETAIALGAVAVDESFISDLIEDYYKHRLSYANALFGDPESRPFLTSDQIKNLEELVAEVRRLYQAPRPHRVNWEVAAKTGKMTDLYVTIYRMTSGDAAHTTVYALDRHIEPDEHGRIKNMTFRPETRDLEHALSVATNALLHSMVPIIYLFPSNGFEQMVKSGMDRWDDLYQNRF